MYRVLKDGSGGSPELATPCSRRYEGRTATPNYPPGQPSALDSRAASRRPSRRGSHRGMDGGAKDEGREQVELAARDRVRRPRAGLGFSCQFRSGLHDGDAELPGGLGRVVSALFAPDDHPAGARRRRATAARASASSSSGEGLRACVIVRQLSVILLPLDCAQRHQIQHLRSPRKRSNGPARVPPSPSASPGASPRRRRRISPPRAT